MLRHTPWLFQPATLGGLEPPTFSVSGRCAANCATGLGPIPKGRLLKCGRLPGSVVLGLPLANQCGSLVGGALSCIACPGCPEVFAARCAVEGSLSISQGLVCLLLLELRIVQEITLV